MYKIDDKILYTSYAKKYGPGSGILVEGFITEPLPDMKKSNIYRIADQRSGEATALRYQSWRKTPVFRHGDISQY